MAIVYSLRFPFFGKFESAIKVSVVLQLFILFLSALVLDGGQLSQWMLVSATAYWIAFAVIMIRRNGNATVLDRFILAWGYPLAIVLAGFIFGIVPAGFLRPS